MIDIGGPSLIRAAAKNQERVSVVVDPSDYTLLLEELDQNEGQVSAELRQRLMVKAFTHTAHYDSAISEYFRQKSEEAIRH